MRARRFIYLEDECPALGAGWRLVEAQIGYKWVFVKEPHAQRRSRLKRSVWDKISRRKYETKEKASA